MYRTNYRLSCAFASAFTPRGREQQLSAALLLGILCMRHRETTAEVKSGVTLAHSRAVTDDQAGIFSVISQYPRDGRRECWLTLFVGSTPVSIEDARGDVVAARCDDSLARTDDSDACHRFIADRAASLFRPFVSHSGSTGRKLNLTR